MNNFIWKTLEHGGRVKRRWLYTGIQRGKQCNFECEIVSRHPDLREYYEIRAVFAHNCAFVPDWANLKDLKPL